MPRLRPAHPDEILSIWQVRDLDVVSHLAHNVAVAPRALATTQCYGQNRFHRAREDERDVRQGARDQTHLGDLEPIEGVAIRGAASARALGHVNHDRPLLMSPLPPFCGQGAPRLDIGAQLTTAASLSVVIARHRLDLLEP